jgi:CubicO group peptidase (beta-lactamase class C family)
MTGLQEQVQQGIDELVATGAEVGLQVAVQRHGHTIVDAVSGVARSGVPVAADTLFYAASAAHALVQSGTLIYDLRLADVWPEFGVHGKDGVTMRHVLLHTAGVPGLPADTTVANLCDWQHMCTVIAEAEPWWEPGTRMGYHGPSPAPRARSAPSSRDRAKA